VRLDDAPGLRLVLGHVQVGPNGRLWVGERTFSGHLNEGRLSGSPAPLLNGDKWGAKLPMR